MAKTHIIIISVLMITAISVNSAPYTTPCVIDLCTEAGGTIAVYLTDTTCSANAVDYLTSKCGVGYSGTTCTVDCSSIYSWHGSYWSLQGCSILGNPCGSAGECSSSVANVCQEAISASPSSASPTPTIHSSTSSRASLPIGLGVGLTLGACFLALCCMCGGFSGSGGGGSSSTVRASDSSTTQVKGRSSSPLKRPSSPARSPSGPSSGPSWGMMDDSDRQRAAYVEQSQRNMQR